MSGNHYSRSTAARKGWATRRGRTVYIPMPEMTTITTEAYKAIMMELQSHRATLAEALTMLEADERRDWGDTVAAVEKHLREGLENPHGVDVTA